MHNSASLGCDMGTLLWNTDTYSESLDSEVEEGLDALDLAFDEVQEQFITLIGSTYFHRSKFENRHHCNARKSRSQCRRRR
ncbi:hypothetical protein GCK72_022388 [Caenorhabditis remanei]|uniref:Uncharacterized protein n=1 Tax=Caenorhabditis remanei TaxID=31234 RepID=A0A6A5FTM2_CAERE|nr:hypothetical protein GCK72_022388 [Caenorhabditis remanei]KAF1745940.1 hypothetical protein GCK72_022388 [Caenorhabditis remanei]